MSTNDEREALRKAEKVIRFLLSSTSPVDGNNAPAKARRRAERFLSEIASLPAPDTAGEVVVKPPKCLDCGRELNDHSSACYRDNPDDWTVNRVEAYFTDKAAPQPPAPGGADPELIARVEAIASATGKDRWKIANLTGHDWRRILAALANHSPDAGGVGEAWVCDGIPDEVIEAGISAWDAAKHDMENYVSGVTTDWDEGMIVAAIYKAMSAALRPDPRGEG